MLLGIESRKMPSQANNPYPSQAAIARDADLDELDNLLHRIRVGLSVVDVKPRVEYDDDLGGRDESEVEIAIRFRTRLGDAAHDLKLITRIVAGIVGT